MSFPVPFLNFCTLLCIGVLRTGLPGFQGLYQPFKYVVFVFLQLPLLANWINFQDLLKEACKSFIAPLALTMKTAPFNTQQVKDGVETFFSQWCRPMGLLLQVIKYGSRLLLVIRPLRRSLDGSSLIIIITLQIPFDKNADGATFRPFKNMLL